MASTIDAQRFIVNAKPGFPDRTEVRDLDIGDAAILLNYEHQSADTPYRSCHAIFVREGAQKALDVVDQLPGAIRIRPISLRAFDAAGSMLHADLEEGSKLERMIVRSFTDPEVAYLHAHYVERACYAARIVPA